MKTILVAITDPLLAPEALHTAAASGNEVIDGADPRQLARFLPRADVVFAGTDTIQAITQLGPRPGCQLYLLYNDPDQPPPPQEGVRTMSLPAQAKELLHALAQRDSKQANKIVGVVGAVGGAGASVFAALLAEKHNALFVDTHAHGGADLLFGAEQQPGPRWPDLQLQDGNIDASQLLAALPVGEGSGVAVLTSPRAGYEVNTRDVAAVLRCVRQADEDLATVVDLSRKRALLQLCDSLIILTPPELRAMVACAGLVEQCRQDSLPVSVVLAQRSWSGLSISECENIAAADITAAYRFSRGVAKHIEMLGIPRRPPRGLRRALEAVA